ncbi:MAG TPA: cytochrome c3 family protein [Vicinamibacteria bacterium]|nr:cytochrome c3 family protein [Vicinamibacteria bacterium]
MTGNSRVLLVGSFITLLANSLSAQNNCIDCHVTLDDEALSAPARAMSEDVHAQAGMGCADCHGGDPTLAIIDGDYDPAKEPSTGFVGAPGYADVPQFCGKCHADAAYMQRFNPNLAVDQLAQYWTSVHGQKLVEGATDVAQCVSCHGAHGTLSPRDPRSQVYPTRVAETCAGCHASQEHMAPYGIPVDQLEQYRASVHGRALDGGDLSAPTCNTCHGNHGATPPGLSSVSLVCGNCHAIQREFFGASPHFEAFAEIGEPECETCHGNHDVQHADDQLLGVEVGQICGDCHFEGEEPYNVAQAMRADLEELKTAIADARGTVEQASVAGMEVSEAELVLIDANQALVQARNAVHAVSPETLREETDPGRNFAQTAREMGLFALEELQYRRRGLAVSVFFILLVVAGLYFKIRQIEEEKSQ